MAAFIVDAVALHIDLKRGVVSLPSVSDVGTIN
jgi:hypothetical protein